MPRPRLLPAVLALALAGCGPTPSAPGTPVAGQSSAPSAAPGAVASTGPATAPTPAPADHLITALGAPDVAVTAISLTTRPAAGGATFADLLKDNDARDDFDPEVPVIFQAPGYAAATEPNAKLRTRGKSTREAEQKSFRIELAKGQPTWRDQADLQLNKHPYDNTRMRNKLAMDLLAASHDLTVPATWFRTLSVDGQDQGFYTDVERVDKRFLTRHGLDAKGWLYKAENFEFLRDPEVLKEEGSAGYDKKAFEAHLDPIGAKGHAPLLAMLDAVNDLNVPIDQTLDAHFDRANFVTWFATNILADNLDTNSQNFYLYLPAGGGKWRFLCWDYDGSFGWADQDGRDRFDARWTEGPGNWWGMPLMRRFLMVPANREALRVRVQELRGTLFAPERIQSLIAAYKPVVGPYVAKAPDRSPIELAAGSGQAVQIWETQVAKLPGAIDAALARFEAGYKRPMPFFLGEAGDESGERRFAWDASFDFQGDALTYDLTIASDPQLTAVVESRKGLTDTQAYLPLPAGVYYWTVTARDASGEWQIPFDEYEAEDGKRYFGRMRSELK